MSIRLSGCGSGWHPQLIEIETRCDGLSRTVNPRPRDRVRTGQLQSLIERGYWLPVDIKYIHIDMMRHLKLVGYRRLGIKRIGVIL